MLIQEFVDTHVATANSDLNFILFNAYCDFFRAKVVDSSTLSHEHDLKLIPIRIIVDKFGNFVIDGIILARNVNGNPSLQIDDVVLKCITF